MTTAREQTARLADLLRREHSAMADFLVALAAFDRKRRWEELGHASLFSFLRRELRLSAGAAQYRKTAAELVQRYPDVEAALRDGRLCLSSVIELAKVVTPENSAELLPRFFGLSSRDAAAVAVSIRPVEDAPRREVVTSLRLSAPAAAVDGEPTAPAPADDDPGPSAFRAPEAPGPRSTPCVTAQAPIRPRPAPVEVEPLDADLRRLHVTVSRRLLDKLEAARAALSHSHPGASADTILEAGLDLLLERAAKRKGIVSKPRAAARPMTSAAIPASVKREVWKRVGGCCEWALEGGGICGSTLRLEFDHVVPRARGGPSTVENLRVLCRAHNQLAARRAFGDLWMDRFTNRSGCEQTSE